MIEFKKSLAINVALTFIGLTFLIAGAFLIFYLDVWFFILAVFGAFFSIVGICDIFFFGKKIKHMSGKDRAKDVILEQIHYLSRKVYRKKTEIIKHEEKAKKLSEEVEYLYNASNNLKETIK